jgi:hypothetical protein
VKVSAAGISLGGERLGDAPADAPGVAPGKVDPLFVRLKEQREAWKMAHPQGEFPGFLRVEIGAELSCQVAMQVYMSAMFAGYPHITLIQGATVLDLPADVPRPPSPEEPGEQEPQLAFAVFHADGSVELKPKRCMGAYDSVPDAALGATVKEWCGARGDCLGALHLRCEVGVPMARVMASLAELHRGAKKVRLGTAAACKPGEGESDPFGGVSGQEGSSLWGDEAPASSVEAPRGPSPGKAGAKKARALSVREGLVTATGGLSEGEVREGMKATRAELEGCYQAALERNPNLEGRVTLAMEVGKKGGVMSARNGGSDIPDSGVVRCVQRAAGAVVFPAKGAVTQVRYPVMFQPH